MNFKIIIGPANSGKSQRLCREIVQAAADAPDENFIALVPEQFTLQMQRRVVETSPAHAVMNIDILSFNRLALKVFNELGINLNEVLDDTGKALVLRKVLDENAKGLSIYRKSVHMEGFIDEMKSVITELKAYGITQADLQAARESLGNENPELSKKLSDIGLVCKAFDDEIRDIYTTSEEVPDLFARKLYFSERIKNANVYIDGFTGFTPVQYKIIEGLFSVCRSVTCSITAPANALGGSRGETDLFYLPNETYKNLIDTAAKANVKADVVSYEPAGEAQAEDELINSAAGNQADIYEYEAENISDEVFFAVNEIARLVRKENFRYREIAVVVPDMKKYYPYLEKSFRQLKIPAFIDYKAKIGSNGFARYVLSALRIVKERFSYDSVFSYLKCGFSGLNSDETEMLENYCLEFGIRGAVAWNRPFIKNRSLRESDEKAWNLDDINALRERFMSGISSFAARAKRSKTAADYQNAFEALFEANNIGNQLKEMERNFKKEGLEREAGEYGQIFGIMSDLFDKARVLSKESSISLDDYIKIVQRGISEIKIGLIPPTLDMVTAGDLERTRLNKIKALFVLGANEGELPSAGGQAGILNARDRQALKEIELSLAPSPAEDICSQRYYLYLMLNKPKKYLYLCRPVQTEDGQSAARSEIFDGLDEYVPGAKERLKCLIPTEGAGKYDEDSGLAVLGAQIGRYAQAGDEGVIEKGLLKYFCEKKPQEVLKIIEGAFYVNKESALDAEMMEAVYGKSLRGSASRFESFNECAFMHFLRYGLNISERAEYGLKADSLGTIYHSALEKYVRSVNEAGCGIRNISDEQSREIAKEAAAEAISEEESHVLESSARSLYQASRTIDVIVKTTDVIREKIKAGRYDIAAVEQRFSTGLGGGDVFSGIIDRIDIYDTGDDVYVNIIDYKTGSKEFDLNEAARGTQLQLPVYLSCAMDIVSRSHPGKKVHPAGVYYFLVRDEFESEKKREKEDSNLKGYSDEEERMRKLMDYTRDKLIQTADRIKNGDVTPAPLKENGKIKACEYCEYKEICRFKEGKFGAKARQAVHLSMAALEDEIYG